MLELPLSSWIILFVAGFLCHKATWGFARFLPWHESAVNSCMPLFFGAALAPFLLGFISILALKLLPGQSHNAHLVFIFAGLIFCVYFPSLWGRGRAVGSGRVGIFTQAKSVFCRNILTPSSPKVGGRRRNIAIDEKIAVFLLGAFALSLIISAVVFPLTQADALEYAQMGRIVFDTGTIDSYPPLIPGNHPSGFYLPVTHPPLYVALVYTSYLMQGHADMPLLMRFISAWITLAATGLIFASGLMINRRAGIFAALLFISTPLLFMGAATSLIDPLSVLGFALVFASIFCFYAQSFKLGCLQGGILGITLWSHSQAVLFPLLLIAGLVFYNGIFYVIRQWRSLIPQFLSLIATGIAIGSWPYIENYKKLGSFISDNPLVFSMQNLAWNDFFLIGRGVDSLPAQIQYGLFKGWFAPEAFGLVFWLVTAGIFRLPEPLLNKKPQRDEKKNILTAALAVVIIYHAGVALAIFLGINQMFRIERYMLVLLPCVCLLAGFVLANFFDQHGKIKLRRIFAFGVLLLVSLQLVVFSLKQQSLATNPQQQVISFIKENLPVNSLVFATQSADMYYANKPMIGNLDPRLENFYLATTPEQGWKLLKELGITHIYVVENALPSFYNSQLHAIIADNRLTNLLYSADGNQLYSINPHKLNRQRNPAFDFSPVNIEWQKTLNLLIGGRKALAKIKLSSETIGGRLYSETKLPLSLFQRDIATLLQTEPSVPVLGEKEYQVEFGLKGQGLLRFWLTQYDGQGKATGDAYLLSEAILSKKYSERKAVYRFKTLPSSRYLQIGIEHYGNSQVEIGSALLKPL